MNELWFWVSDYLQINLFLWTILLAEVIYLLVNQMIWTDTSDEPLLQIYVRMLKTAQYVRVTDFYSTNQPVY